MERRGLVRSGMSVDALLINGWSAALLAPVVHQPSAHALASRRRLASRPKSRQRRIAVG